MGFQRHESIGISMNVSVSHSKIAVLGTGQYTQYTNTSNWTCVPRGSSENVVESQGHPRRAPDACGTMAMFKQIITACCPWTCGSRCWGRRASWWPPPRFPCRAPPPGADNCTAQRGLNGQVHELADTRAGTSRGMSGLQWHTHHRIHSTGSAHLELGADLAVALLHIAHGDVLLQARAEGAAGDLADLHVGFSGFQDGASCPFVLCSALMGCPGCHAAMLRGAWTIQPEFG